MLQRSPLLPPLISHLSWPPLTRNGLGRMKCSLRPGSGQSCIACTRDHKKHGKGGSKLSDPPHITLPNHFGYQPSLIKDKTVKRITLLLPLAKHSCRSHVVWLSAYRTIPASLPLSSCPTLVAAAQMWTALFFGKTHAWLAGPGRMTPCQPPA